MGMDDFRKNLLKDRASFLRKVRVFTMLLGVAVLCLLTVILFLNRKRAAPAGSGVRLKNDFPQPDRGGIMVVPVDPEAHPSQLIPREVLLEERHGTPRRKLPDGSTSTVINGDTLRQVLMILREVPEENLAGMADQSITYATFADKELRDEIQGRVCTFRGVLRRFEKLPGASLHDISMGSIYEAQLQDALGHWFTVYCFEKPEELPTRRDATEVTGVFYKLIWYSTKEGGDMVTPLIVARTVHIRYDLRPAPTFSERVVEGAPPWALGVALGVMAAVVVVVLTLALRRKPKRPPLVRRRPVAKDD